MKRDLGIASCGLACCLCSENTVCKGCHADACEDRARCENRNCCKEKGLSHCWRCGEDCRKGILAKIKPYAFTRFMKRYGEARLLDCLAANEQKGVVYHREGIFGDYDAFDDVEELIAFLLAGPR